MTEGISLKPFLGKQWGNNYVRMVLLVDLSWICKFCNIKRSSEGQVDKAFLQPEVACLNSFHKSTPAGNVVAFKHQRLLFGWKWRPDTKQSSSQPGRQITFTYELRLAGWCFCCCWEPPSPLHPAFLMQTKGGHLLHFFFW